MKRSLFPLPQSTYENNHQKTVPPFLIHIVITGTANSCPQVNTSVRLLQFEIFKESGGGSVLASLMPKSQANTFSHWYSTVLCC